MRNPPSPRLRLPTRLLVIDAFGLVDDLNYFLQRTDRAVAIDHSLDDVRDRIFRRITPTPAFDSNFVAMGPPCR